MGRPCLGKRKLAHNVSVALSVEDGDMLQELSVITKKPIGRLVREALVPFLAEQKSAIFEFRATKEALE
jgi:hypothetical protein